MTNERMCNGHYKVFFEELDNLGRLSDTADNYIHAAKLPMPPDFHVKALTAGLEEIRDHLRKLYSEVAGDDPWKS